MMIKYLANTSDYTDLETTVIYKVISIDFLLIDMKFPCFKIMFRVLNRKGVAGLYDQSMFEVVDSLYDDDFVFKQNGNGSFELVPNGMSYSGFWEGFFDGNSNEVDIFKKRFSEYKDMLS